ncbi:MAG: glucans biosynthesis glucosyltransferase MdoH [Pseudomonadota bacterium]
MNQFSRGFNADSVTAHPSLPPESAEKHGLTPAGLQSQSTLARRRAIFFALNAVSMAGLVWMLMMAFSAGGWSTSDLIILGCFLVGAPWTVMGVWNALIGVWLLHARSDGLADAAPHLTAMDGTASLTTRTALAMTVRNEDPERSFRRLTEMRRALDATGQGAQFDVFILSDTTEPEIAAREELLFRAMRAELGGVRATYRRRHVNTGFKAGNVREFLQAEGRNYDYFLPLDSDSLMSGAAIVRMVRVMETYPRIGILQSLVVGTPASSAFARIFQFGMRHGMRSFTMGSAWWQGDCGPYWGHNALLRVGAFRRHCRLPILPGDGPLSGHILSHDQLEATLMRRAGYEVRVLPIETESWEDNPPTLMDFTKRDLRWCQGNMQYWSLLGMRGLKPTSRFQIFAAIMMYMGAPAWMLMTGAAASKLVFPDPGGIDLAFGIAMFFIMFAVSLVPKLLGLLDIVLTPGGVARYGGSGRFALGAATETVFSILLAPVVALRVTIFLIGLAMGRTVTWSGQNRDAYALDWADAARGLWPQTLFGATLIAMVLALASPGTLLWAAPMVTGLVLAIPFAVVTASTGLGRMLERLGICATPDEFQTPESLRNLNSPMGVTEQSAAA